MKHTLAVTAVALLAAQAAALKGVAPQDKDKYVPDADGMWACLGDPSIRIPFDRVNDDYCDCPDGSDEPGTGACAGVGNMKHYCENKGHIASYIPVRYVNDGVCDYKVCCDGSDEPEGVCPNRCREVHEDYIVKQKAAEEARARGLKKRAELVVEAEKRKTWLEKELTKRKQALAAKETEVQEAKVKLEEAEADAIEHGVSAVDEKVVEAKAELVRLSEVSTRLRTDLIIALERQRQLDSVLAKMKEDYNPNFNDPAVKQAIRDWEDIVGAGTLSPNLDLLDTSRGNEILDEISEISVVGSAGSSVVSDGLRWLAETFGWTGAVPAPKRDFTSAKVEDAKQRLGDLERELSDLKSQITKDEHTIGFNFGKDDILRALSETCIKNKVGEYDYEVCFFGDARQVGHGQATKLGKFSKVEFANDVFYLQFENGAQCWNGPIRRAEVTVRCGEETKIVGVSEPEKCAYYIDMISPAACSPDHILDAAHDEL